MSTIIIIINYWERLKKLGLMSLQRRRERYIIIHVWKIVNNLAPNDIGMIFKRTPRLGLMAVTPPLNNTAQNSVVTNYESSFAVNATKLWNLLPKTAKEQTLLEPFKRSLGVFIDTFVDTPPTRGYSAANDNSLLAWARGGLRCGRT